MITETRAPDNGGAATFRIRHAALADRPGLWDIAVDAGIVESIAPSGAVPGAVEDGSDGAAGAAPAYDLAGRLLLPGFVDVHVHLDKAYQLDALSRIDVAGTGLAKALAATAALRPQLDAPTLMRNAQRAVDTMSAGGTVAARVHVEISSSSDPAAVRLHRELAEQNPGIHFELAAFAQHGTTADRDVAARFEKAIDDGCVVVGGCPYADPDPLRHLDHVIALAVDRNLPLDLHLDLSDDEGDLLLDEVVHRVERSGLQGRVNIGHETTLTALAPERVRELARATAGAGITVTSIPSTDLYLSGRGSERAPTRGVTRVRELLAAGVPVALASNNYENAFTPVSMPALSQAAWLASLVCHMGEEGEQLALLDGITTVPRTILGIPAPGLETGAPVGANVFDVAAPVDVVRRSSMPVATFTPAGVRGRESL